MEGLNNVESFESFKNKIAEIFKREGLSENLKSEIERWIDSVYERYHKYGSSAEERISIQLQIAQIYGVTEQYDNSWDILSDVWVYADGIKNAKLVKEVDDLMDSIHGKK
ncbi:MAG: hypothetical protein A2431_01800 [Candidatus Zambryskibacteria bacterium RIFOXYC1_FULL_39_10]|uniref:Uncharacterized protein n=1 Tax=Candidatus Zambryskibacteria bacterium RIFOXYC1_FULL_39_10 TaxID=1802779 RepID=A0A1G2V471_9BACT|nr:MAG: hypothetical protein A2605_02930 [Candidatus Zambryskibacteria bacterium RIFOXYD1_FULL_39_35]OHB16412.1 MAG: hypothetical protein A2431_01800 [Candidatus Zambryskibacteria bacterium RIFOXYC1_FULL_39_10]